MINRSHVLLGSATWRSDWVHEIVDPASSSPGVPWHSFIH
jgi:hypothetical protein